MPYGSSKNQTVSVAGLSVILNRFLFSTALIRKPYDDPSKLSKRSRNQSCP